MIKYECWLVLDENGNGKGHFDYTNGGFNQAALHCVYLNDEFPEFHCMVEVSIPEDQ